MVMADTELWEQKLESTSACGMTGLQADFDERNLLRDSEKTRINNSGLRVMSALATPNECAPKRGLAAHAGRVMS